MIQNHIAKFILFLIVLIYTSASAQIDLPRGSQKALVLQYNSINNKAITFSKHSFKGEDKWYTSWFHGNGLHQKNNTEMEA